MRLLKRLLLPILLALGPAAAVAEEIAIVGADVLPMTGEERLADQIVLVSGDRITAIGPSGQMPIPEGARVIDARGLTMMPGLVDMHVHLAPTPGEPGDPAHRALAVMLGHGVTTARLMVGSPNNLRVRDGVEAGMISGPRLYVAAPGLTANNTASPEAARAAVASAKSAGYDFIKIFNLPELETWQALQDSARQAGLPVAGHVANAIGTERAAAAGQQIEHLDGMLHALLPEPSPARQEPFGQFPPPPVLEVLGATSDDAIRALARRIAQTRSWHVPTLSLFERFTDMETPIERLRGASELRFVPDPVIEQWASQRDQFRQQSGYSAAHAGSFAELRRRIAGALHQAGVPLMPGSDSAQQFQLWGVGLLAEIDALEAAGLSRMDALRSATRVPRDYFRSLPNGGSSLGWRAEFGTVQAGARADLILLRADPSADLANLRQLESVIAAGRFYDRATLDRMLEEAATAAKAAT